MNGDQKKMLDRIADLEAEVAVLERDLIHDSLTGLKTRAFFDETASDLLKLLGESDDRRQNVGPQSVSLIFFDIDRFKSINDTHGHLTGDLVIRQVASTIKYNFRETDIVARWGGEEFVALLPGASEALAQIEAEKIREMVSKLKFKDHPNLQVTLSAGVAEAVPGLTLEQFVGQADKALYWAKEHGRNMIVAFSGLESAEKSLPQKLVLGEVA